MKCTLICKTLLSRLLISICVSLTLLPLKDVRRFQDDKPSSSHLPPCRFTVHFGGSFSKTSEAWKATFRDQHAI